MLDGGGLNLIFKNMQLGSNPREARFFFILFCYFCINDTVSNNAKKTYMYISLDT